MKYIIKISALCLTSLAFASCAGFLDENPTTQVSQLDNVYDSKEYLEGHLQGCYAEMHSSDLWCSWRMEYVDCASALTFFGSKRTTNSWLDQLKLTKYSDTSRGNNAMWARLYNGVNRCNRLLDNLPASPVDSSFKREIEAEAKFIRAIFYYDIVRYWGDVPLHLKSPSNYSESNLPKTAYYKVYKQILDDLDFAWLNMRDKARQEQLNPEKDHFYNYAALAYKASVYLTIGSLLSAPANDQFWDSSKDAALIAAGKDPRTPDFKPCGINDAKDAFKLALACADSVIASGPYHLADDYRQLFRWKEHKDFYLDEAICRLQISANAGDAGNIVAWVAPAYPEGTRDSTQYNGNRYKVCPSRWGTENFIMRTGGTKGKTFPTDQIYTTSKDPRYATAMKDRYLNLNTKKYANTYPSYPSYTAKDSSKILSNTGSPYIWKYINPAYNGDAGQCAFYVMRLAEMYLISAEASAQLSGGPGDAAWDKAISRVMTLRDRAAKSNDNGTTDAAVAAALKWESGTFSSLEELRDAVWWERYIEMAFEGHEYFDTHRYGATWLSEKIAKPANEFYFGKEINKKFREYHVPSATTEIYPQDPVQLRKSLLLAFPQTELTANPKLGGTAGVNDFYWQ